MPLVHESFYDDIKRGAQIVSMPAWQCGATSFTHSLLWPTMDFN